MKREKIIISESGIISNPDETVWMRDFEIAELFGVMLPSVKLNIRAILKSNVATGDTTNGATLVGRNIVPDYFRLDMIIALAFWINSLNAKLLREYILGKLYAVNTPSVFIQVNTDKRLNKGKVIFN